MPVTNYVHTATSNDRHGVSNYWPIECLFSSLLRLIKKKHQRSALLSLCEGNPPESGGFPAQRGSNAESASIWWRHKDIHLLLYQVAHESANGVLTIGFYFDPVTLNFDLMPWPKTCRNQSHGNQKRISSVIIRQAIFTSIGILTCLRSNNSIIPSALIWNALVKALQQRHCLCPCRQNIVILCNFPCAVHRKN